MYDHARRIVNTEPGRKWGNDSPRLRWNDGVIEDLAILGCRNLKIVVQDINECRWLFGRIGVVEYLRTLL